MRTCLHSFLQLYQNFALTLTELEHPEKYGIDVELDPQEF
jgi:hypothetical protein|tara:strand:- start:10624 stop:10743 length:120 start_codon:yes stop_codon:yes gene_type:complete